MPNSRAVLVEQLEKNLLGPRDGADETLPEGEFPDRRYVVGILYPRSTEMGAEAESDNGPETEPDDESGYSPGARSPIIHEKKPSSMGITAVVAAGQGGVVLTVKWATYDFESVSGGHAWRRREQERTFHLHFPLSAGHWEQELWPQGEPNARAYRVRAETRAGADESLVLSVFLLNNEEAHEDPRVINRRCIFSPTLRLSGEGRVFSARPDEALIAPDQDIESLRLLYHGRFEFASGHGCSVRWGDVEKDRCGWIESTYLPRYGQRRLSWPELPYLSIGRMGDPQRFPQTLQDLDRFVGEYERWIRDTFAPRAREDLPASLRPVFDHHEHDCRLAVQRMRTGLSLLHTRPLVKEAFLFMGQSMYLQRLHADEIERVRQGFGLTYSEPNRATAENLDRVRWRPFQIAFILENLPDIADPTSTYRSETDLLWVGTGGGKTEAYLGLAAFAMAYRRLRAGTDDLNSRGVSVLMRYTLRLLSIQQFQRAASLMCACEVLREEARGRFGERSHPFLVGLFVGGDTTPNRIGIPSRRRRVPRSGAARDGSNGAARSAWEILEEYQRTGQLPEGSSPFQLSHCPWCGTELTTGSYSIQDDITFQTRCPREGCHFHTREIPAITVDENVYQRLPALVIGTVDKFAQLPFDPTVAALFGHVRARCGRHGFVARDDDARHACGGRPSVEVQRPLPPPDLIIQDELHLLNGPLGSMVGLYETAIHYLCTDDRDGASIHPKIIASTATVRRAQDQVRSIFAQRVHRFPPPGVTVSDSFFVRDQGDDSEDKLYLGAIPSGIGAKTLVKKVIGTILKTTASMKAAAPTSREWDPFWTTVAYFNSIRELGSTKTTIEDDVSNDVHVERPDLRVEELTSNIQSSELPEMLVKMNTPGTDPNALDVVACSNMFSVGVDVQRLGLMVVNSQPKLTSEYIQATGRVGRKGNGLILVLHNWARPRDQSHFERFFDYHQRIQYHVEAITVTPFSVGARRRALHAVLVAAIRGKGPMPLCPQEGAARFDTRARGSEAEKAVVERAHAVAPAALASETEMELEEFLDEWVAAARDYPDLRYSGRADDQSHLLLVRDPEEAEAAPPDGGPRRFAPNSLRNVENELPLTWVSRGSRRRR